jgi:hypothetical protein
MARDCTKDSKKKAEQERNSTPPMRLLKSIHMVQQTASRGLFVIDRSFTPSFGAKSTPNTVRALTARDRRCHSSEVARIDAVVEEADRAVS